MRLSLSSDVMLLRPDRFPPGLGKLPPLPRCSGALALLNTTGILEVAFLTASVSSFDHVTMTSGLVTTRSRALGVASSTLAGHRATTTRFRPSTYPRSVSPRRSATIGGGESPWHAGGIPTPRTPIRHALPAGCASAATGVAKNARSTRNRMAITGPIINGPPDWGKCAELAV